MNNLLSGILVVILALNLFALGSRSILQVIRIIALQGILIGLLPLLLHGSISFGQGFAAIAAISLKGIVIPVVLIRALRDAKIKREVEPLIGFVPSILLGSAVTIVSFLLFRTLPADTGEHERMIIPASITTILIGFILLITRYKAITQVMGYLVLENGIYIFSLLLVVAIPLVVEMGMLLDLFVSVFIISIIIHHINQAFSSQDTRKLTALKE